MFIKLGLMVNLSMRLNFRSCPSVVANWTILKEFKNVCNDRTSCMCKMILFRKINPCKYFLAASSNQVGEKNFFLNHSLLTSQRVSMQNSMNIAITFMEILAKTELSIKCFRSIILFTMQSVAQNVFLSPWPLTLVCLTFQQMKIA